jgi:hypothetical protein
MLRSGSVACVAAILILSSAASAEPLSIRIDDYDFTFDTDYAATYAYNADSADTLMITDVGSAVGTYRYLGTDGATDLLGNAAGLYPVWGPAGGFGGDLELEMEFTVNDGPYDSGTDTLDISLAGNGGRLEITGSIGFMPGAPITLLEILFDDTSLLGRADDDVVDLIEGQGLVTTLLGEDVQAEGIVGGAFMKFFAENIVFPEPPGETYDPLTDYGYGDVDGRVSGETGEIPEPASMAILGLGGLAMLLRRRGR